ncbi:tRNA pseudouridine(38-40) synthase TruA, partial [Pseudomonas aeruginosa]|nr:tRNA pseudouridine(38-40) synthase TruA [Pseudomonas aeruginosa]
MNDVVPPAAAESAAAGVSTLALGIPVQRARDRGRPAPGAGG